ncbi:MAG TPA: PA2169 family four-helix-bundle protein [Pyrinomonadaceae bacterium]|jgi:uncharacterized protein (TIGR02284 family)
MATQNEAVVSTLNDLIETCRDGQQGFQTAAEGVKSGDLKTLFLNYAQQRAQFIAELQTEVRQLGGKPEETGSVAGSLHRGWLNIKAAVTGQDEKAVISEVERGEDTSVASYREALGKEELPADIRAIVERQLAAVKEAHDRVRAIEQAAGA